MAQELNPQGYNYGIDPLNVNPFWGGNEPTPTPTPAEVVEIDVSQLPYNGVLPLGELFVDDNIGAIITIDDLAGYITLKEYDGIGHSGDDEYYKCKNVQPTIEENADTLKINSSGITTEYENPITLEAGSCQGCMKVKTIFCYMSKDDFGMHLIPVFMTSKNTRYDHVDELFRFLQPKYSIAGNSVHLSILDEENVGKYGHFGAPVITKSSSGEYYVSFSGYKIPPCYINGSGTIVTQSFASKGEIDNSPEVVVKPAETLNQLCLEFVEAIIRIYRR